MLFERARAELTDGRRPSFEPVVKKDYKVKDVALLAGTAWALGMKDLAMKLEQWITSLDLSQTRGCAIQSPLKHERTGKIGPAYNVALRHNHRVHTSFGAFA